MKYFTAKRLGNIAAGAVLFFLLGAFVSIPSPIETVGKCCCICNTMVCFNKFNTETS